MRTVRHTTTLLLAGAAVIGSGGSVTPTAAAATRAADSRMTAVATLVAADCLEPSAIVDVPAERSAAVLPAGYAPTSFLGAPGQASVLVGVATCQRGTIDGVPLRAPFSLGERVLQVASRDETPGLQFYAYEQVSDVPEIVRALRRAGFPAVLDRTVGGRTNGLGAASKGGSVDVDVRVGLPVPSPLSRSTIWRESVRGTARLDLEVDRPSAEAGIGQVAATPGSPTFALFGGPRATGIGAINHFGYTATLRAEHPAPAGPSLAVSPTCVVSGRVATLALRATSDGEPVAGATVRFGNRSALLDAGGLGQLRVRARGRGTIRLVRARLADGTVVTVPVRVVRRSSRCGRPPTTPAAAAPRRATPTPHTAAGPATPTPVVPDPADRR